MNIPLRSRGYLPHLESQKPIYFVTFRLADSLPREVLAQLRAERQTIEKTVNVVPPASCRHVHVVAPASSRPPLSPTDHRRLQKLRAIIQKAERFLDGGHGECFMLDPRIAQIVADAIRHFDGENYRLLAWCVMPNHVHVVFTPLANHTLAAILHSWKSFSAKQANALLNRTGYFWQREYFDHLVRNENSLAKIIDYIKRNPEKAGLKDWPWVGVMS